MDYIQISSNYRKFCTIKPSQPPYKQNMTDCKNIRDGILQAESKFLKLNMGEVPWSRLLQECMGVILLWRVILSRKKLAIVSTWYITILERRVNIHNSLQPSIVQVENCLTNAYHQYYELK